ncbi:MAG: tRNA (adenosine(37)-N6)-dimethylallyltransferase MiaA [Leptolyngbyaceae cyanobacterium CSU_1_3]|nr:tRNA (adenosine(37)-N6)-dimethylallyltransferase MiaA [Leptolyngbyaceae cyanobacterium CSU_1_3]
MGVDQPILSEKPVSDRTISLSNTHVPFLIIVCGATATGKSGLAISLAQRLNSAIVSADSRQVYREFSIGTAKPTVAEQKQVPHYLIDLCNPTETLTLAEYQEQARRLIEPIDKTPPQASLLVGGTGLYIKSIVQGLKIPRVAPQPALRSQLQSLGQAQMYGFLQQVDPKAADRIHAHDQVRTLRALEVFYVTGRPMSEQQGEAPPTYPILQIGLDCADVEGGDRRIQQRTAQMIEIGFEAEVRMLCEKYGEDLPLLDTLGYREMKQYLRGDVSLAEAQRSIVLHTRQFAKRQRTWFRADPRIEWFDADRPDLLDQVWQQIRNFVDNEIADTNLKINEQRF